MKVIVGSKNPSKVAAVKEAISDYDLFSNAHVINKEVDSGVCHQPRNIEETTTGAINRATNAFHDCKYSFGIESGLFDITKGRFLNVTVCAIYDGKHHYLGMSPGFELPPQVASLVLGPEQLGLTKAILRTDLSNDPDLRSRGGIVSVLTNGRITRKDYTKQAIVIGTHCHRK